MPWSQPRRLSGLGYCHLSPFERPTTCDWELRADSYGKRRTCGNAKQMLPPARHRTASHPAEPASWRGTASTPCHEGVTATTPHVFRCLATLLRLKRGTVRDRGSPRRSFRFPPLGPELVAERQPSALQRFNPLTLVTTAPRGRRLRPGRCQCRCLVPQAARCKGPAIAPPV